MKKFKIVRSTDSYHAKRYPGFKIKTDGRGYKILETGLSLEDAKARLLEMLNCDGDVFYTNWGMAVIHSNITLKAYKTFKDGTRLYNYDVFTTSIEIDE